MPNFTPSEIQDARERPREGDVWIVGKRLGYNIIWTIENVAADGLDVYASWTDDLEEHLVVSLDRLLTLNATLVRRGDA